MKFEDLKFETFSDTSRAANFISSKDGQQFGALITVVPEYRGKDENGERYYFDKDEKKNKFAFGFCIEGTEKVDANTWRGVDISTCYDWKGLEEALNKIENYVKPATRKFDIVYGCKDLDDEWDDCNTDFESTMTLKESDIQKQMARGMTEAKAIAVLLESKVEDWYGRKDGVELIERHEHENLDEYPDEDWENETKLVSYEEVGGKKLCWNEEEGEVKAEEDDDYDFDAADDDDDEE